MLTLAGLALPSAAQAAVVWTANFEQGDLSEWSPGINDPGNIEVLGEKVYTGQVPSKRVSHGECIEIATGAPMPDGADAVVMVEDTERADPNVIRVLTPVYPRQHVGRRGADITSGQTLLDRGVVLNPSRIGALAATGVTTIDVFVRPETAHRPTSGLRTVRGFNVARASGPTMDWLAVSDAEPAVLSAFVQRLAREDISP